MFPNRGAIDTGSNGIVGTSSVSSDFSSLDDSLSSPFLSSLFHNHTYTHLYESPSLNHTLFLLVIDPYHPSPLLTQPFFSQVTLLTLPEKPYFKSHSTQKGKFMREHKGKDMEACWQGYVPG